MEKEGKRGKINGIQGKNDGKRGINTKKHPKKFAGALRAPGKKLFLTEGGK